MIELTKCSGDNCPMKENCLRFTKSNTKEVLKPPFQIRDGAISCLLFHGDDQQNILNQLINILK